MKFTRFEEQSGGSEGQRRRSEGDPKGFEGHPWGLRASQWGLSVKQIGHRANRGRRMYLSLETCAGISPYYTQVCLLLEPKVEVKLILFISVFSRVHATL